MFFSDPVRALFWPAILNGVVAAPLMALIINDGFKSKRMGNFVLPSYRKSGGWVATGAMLCVWVGVFFTRCFQEGLPIKLDEASASCGKGVNDPDLDA